MISWWSVVFHDQFEGQTGYLKYDVDSGMSLGVFFEDGTQPSGEYSYTTIETDVLPPEWA